MNKRLFARSEYFIHLFYCFFFPQLTVGSEVIKK